MQNEKKKRLKMLFTNIFSYGSLSQFYLRNVIHTASCKYIFIQARIDSFLHDWRWKVLNEWNEMKEKLRWEKNLRAKKRLTD